MATVKGSVSSTIPFSARASSTRPFVWEGGADGKSQGEGPLMKGVAYGA